MTEPALDSTGIVEPPTTLWTALRKIGPGIILAGSIVGSGELIQTTALGAKWGFTFLWLILFSCLIKVFVQIELGRYAISSGKSTLAALNEMPGWRLRVHWQVWWWFFMLLLTVMQLGAMVGGVGQALNLAFPDVSPRMAEWLGKESFFGDVLVKHPEFPWAGFTAVAAIALLLSGGYKSLERITTALVAGVTLITCLCVFALKKTGYPISVDDLVKGMSLGLPAAGIAAAFATFGITGVGASELYSYPYWCLEKGYARFAGSRSDDPEWARRANGWMRVLHLDAWVSMVVFTLATVSFYSLGATVLYRQGLVPEGSKVIAVLSEMYVPSFGSWTKLFFLIGAWAVLFKTLYVASAGHSRLVADFLNLAGFVEYPNEHSRHRMVRWLCVGFPTLSMILYVVIQDPSGMVRFGGFIQAVTLPVISGAALYFRYKKVDPRIAPSKTTDLFLWIAFVLITAFATKALYDFALAPPDLAKKYPALARLDLPAKDLPEGCTKPDLKPEDFLVKGLKQGGITTDKQAIAAVAQPFGIDAGTIRAMSYTVYREKGEFGVIGWAFDTVDSATAAERAASQRGRAAAIRRKEQTLVVLWNDVGATDDVMRAMTERVEAALNRTP